MTTFMSCWALCLDALRGRWAFLKAYVEIPPDLEPTEYFIIIIIAAPPSLMYG